jgi:membrane protease YdiL (CAAX protease family)
MESVPPRIIAPPVLEDSPPGTSRSRWWVHLLLIAGYPLIIGLLSAGNGHRSHPALGGTERQLILVAAVEIGLFMVVFGSAWLASRASKEDLFLLWRGSWRPMALGLGYSLALRIAIGILAAATGAFLVITRLLTPDQLQNFLLANRPEIEALVDLSSLKNHAAYYWLNLTLISFVLGGLREELWRAGFLSGLRKLWPDRFATRIGGIIAVLVTAVTFGLGHLIQGPLAVCLTAFLGFGLGLIILFHRSIWPAVFAHGFFNAASFALIPLVVDHLPPIR